jgi:hypothetical protein
VTSASTTPTHGIIYGSTASEPLAATTTATTTDDEYFNQ